MIPQHYIDILQAQVMELSRAESCRELTGPNQQVRNARAALRRTLEKVEPFSRAFKSAAYAYDDILDPA